MRAMVNKGGGKSRVCSVPKDSSNSNQKRTKKQLLGRLEGAVEIHREVQGQEGWNCSKNSENLSEPDCPGMQAFGSHFYPYNRILFTQTPSLPSKTQALLWALALLEGGL